MLQLTKTKANLFDNLDPRVKLFFGVEILILLFFADTIFKILIIFLFPLVFSIIVGGFKNTFHFYWNLKWYLLFISIFMYLFTPSVDIASILLILLKFLTILSAFRILNQTTTPDEITDALMKLKLPVNLAWVIGITLRQATFLYDEIAFIRKIQAKRISNQSNWITSKYYEFYSLISSVMSYSIIRSSDLSNTLIARGFEGSHRGIIYHTSSITYYDLLFLIIILLPIIPILFFSSQLFM